MNSIEAKLQAVTGLEYRELCDKPIRINGFWLDLEEQIDEIDYYIVSLLTDSAVVRLYCVTLDPDGYILSDINADVWMVLRRGEDPLEPNPDPEDPEDPDEYVELSFAAFDGNKLVKSELIQARGYNVRVAEDPALSCFAPGVCHRWRFSEYAKTR